MDRSITYYLSGPMGGIPQFNFPAFNEAARLLRYTGYKIISPAELDDPEARAAALASPDGRTMPAGHTWADYLARDVKVIAEEATGIILLEGWRHSKGAKLEAALAILCGHTFGYYKDLDDGAVLYPLTRREVIEQLGASL